MDALIKFENSLKLIVQLLLLTIVVTLGCSGGGSSSGSEYTIVIKPDDPGDVEDLSNTVVHTYLIVRGTTIALQVDVPDLPTGESLVGFASDLNETTSGISIGTGPCDPGTGTAFCEKWTITATASVPNTNLTVHHEAAFGGIVTNLITQVVKVSSVGETVSVVNRSFNIRVLSPHIVVDDADGTDIVSGERAGGGSGRIDANIGDTITVQIDVPDFLAGDALTEFDYDICITCAVGEVIGATGITISTSPCNVGTGTAFCEEWAIQFAKLGEYKILPSAVGASVPVSNHGIKATISTPSTTSTLSIADASVIEGDTGDDRILEFQLSLDPPSTSFTTLDFATSPGSATAGSDFTSTSGQLIIPAGAISTNINVLVIGDNDDETEEDLTLTLSNLSSNATFGNDSATGTILDRPDPNSLNLNLPIDTGPFPPLLALSPIETQFAGVAYLVGNFDIRFTIEGVTPDLRNSCAPCPELNKDRFQNLNLFYPDGAKFFADQSAGFNFGTWQLRAQIFDTDTGFDHVGHEDFNVVVDPGAFQIIPGSSWQDMTLSLFGDMPGASTSSAVGSCLAGEFEWELRTSIGGAVISTRCVAMNTLTSGGTTDWSFTGLSENIYTATLRYVDGTPSNLGSMQFLRDFNIISP